MAQESAGAHRIELCADRHLGGTTPPLAWLHQLQDHIDIPVHIMIRPRGGDFFYSDSEYAQMEADIDSFKAHPIVRGFVFGVLTGNGRIDVLRNTALVQQVGVGLNCVFHRAIDDTPNLLAAVAEVVQCGFSAVLTSGGAPNAFEGAAVIGEVVEKMESRVYEFAGGGVRARDGGALKAKCKAPWYHSSGIVDGEGDGGRRGMPRLQEVEMWRKAVE